MLTGLLVIVCGLATGAADAGQPGDPPLETALRLVTNGKPATVIYHANGRYDVIVTGSAGHTQHVRSGLWWTEDQTLRHCFVPDTPSRNAGKPFCKKPGHYLGNLVIPVQPPQ